VTDVFGVAKGVIGRAEASEATARYGYFTRAGIVANLGDELFVKEAIVADVALNALPWVYLPVPAGVVYAVRTENLHQSFVYEPPDGVDQLKIFGLVVPPEGSWKDDEWIPAGSEGEDIYVVSEVVGVEFTVGFMHKK
jgi:hypothetical protein